MQQLTAEGDRASTTSSDTISFAHGLDLLGASCSPSLIVAAALIFRRRDVS